MSQSRAFEELFEAVHEATPPGIWSKAVQMVRELSIVEDSRSADEIILRLISPHRPVSPRVSLWPTEGDWHCNCGDRNDPCIHIAAALIAVKNGATRTAEPGKASSNVNTARIEYRFAAVGDALHFERWILSGQRQMQLKESLVSLVGGISSGRIAFPPVAATREDFAVDAALPQYKSGELDALTWLELFKRLSECSNISFEGRPVTASPRPIGAQLCVRNEGEGFRVTLSRTASFDRIFSNGAALQGTTLAAITPTRLSADERARFSENGTVVTRRDLVLWVSEIFPQLESKIPLADLTQGALPRAIAVPPRVIIEARRHEDGRLSATPQIVYGDPAFAKIENDKLIIDSPSRIPLRDRAAETHWTRKIQQELHIPPGHARIASGEEGIRLIEQLKNWNTLGDGKKEFTPEAHLRARIETSDHDFSLRFFSPSGREADASQVFEAWNSGSQHIRLLDGGWATLPLDWLKKYGAQISALLHSRSAEKKLPTFRIPELVSLCEELGQNCNSSLTTFRDRLQNIESIPSAPLPADLTATLRDYQLRGVQWARFLRDQQMGGLLADDMGLGKTLQALCTLEPGKKALIVAPTSVLGSWREQLQRFRPGLSHELFHGPSRTLNPAVDVTLTSYAILRLDQELLTSQYWDTLILDEAQSIRNPESRVARAAHALKGSFRLALSGTPVENRLEDLWSQFQFINPGLLGTKREFQERYLSNLEALRKKIRFFVLRRLKKEVAAELPPRIETVLSAELSEQERDLYDSVLASSREEVLRKLDLENNVIAALEILLRLRQACCHPALLPGQTAPSSSKTELLLETLETSIAEGHRSLVFSQWTGFLDLLEPHFIARKIPFLRIDGSTLNRQEIVDRFQKDGGPPVLLVSLKAGGLGLTLTAADHVFLMDPWWNPAVENQAADRAHRIGQNRTVMIHRLIAAGTIEEKVLALQQAKAALAQELLEGTSGLKTLTKKDILELLM